MSREIFEITCIKYNEQESKLNGDNNAVNTHIHMAQWR